MYFKIIKWVFLGLFLHDGLPDVGDLQRSSEVFNPSLESHSAGGATRVDVRISPTLGLLLIKLSHCLQLSTCGENDKGSAV